MIVISIQRKAGVFPQESDVRNLCALTFYDIVGTGTKILVLGLGTYLGSIQQCQETDW